MVFKIIWKEGNLVEKIAQAEQKIQDNLIDHYLEIWEMSDETQRKKLQKAFQKTLQGPGPGPGRRPLRPGKRPLDR